MVHSLFRQHPQHRAGGMCISWSHDEELFPKQCTSQKNLINESRRNILRGMNHRRDANLGVESWTRCFKRHACGFYPVDVCRDLWYPHVNLSQQLWYWCSDPLHPSQHGQHQMYHHISSASKLYHCSPRTQRDKQESWVICHYNCCMTQW